MGRYFSEDESMKCRFGTRAEAVLRVIANRFAADNPPVPAAYYLRSTRSFPVSDDYMEEVRLHERFPCIEPEHYVYAWAKMTPAQPGPFHFRFIAYGPVTIYVNGVKSFRSDRTQERYENQLCDISLNLKEGSNSLLFECMATPLGCGFRIGSCSYKGRRIQFFSPSGKWEGMSGFIYSNPVREPVTASLEAGGAENTMGLTWYPEIRWTEKERMETPAERIFGKTGDQKVVSAVSADCRGTGAYQLYIRKEKETTFWLDGEEQGRVPEDGRVAVYMTGGSHTFAFAGGAVELEIHAANGRRVPLRCPVLLRGKEELSWLYAGPFDKAEELPIKEMLSFKKPFQAAGKMTFWRADLPDTYLRPFNEGALYGEWSYPLGVTLYGMTESARLLGDKQMFSYVKGHMEKCTSYFDYCLWDKTVYGAAPFHNQLTTINSLDDCGSFSSALAEVMKDTEIREGRKLLDFTADYIRNRQPKLEDGIFFRQVTGLPEGKGTVWADDMYMSIPFLCRYYELSGDDFYLKEAALQVKLFFRYLFLPEQQIMSHVYDTQYETQTKVPWGRGNGWTLFAVSELLMVLPEEWEERPEILEIYRRLCEGYLRLQDENGMWHQVLDLPDSYEEASCTAMFVCGFARGVRFGWLEDSAPLEDAAFRGWEALCGRAIDWKGNIYGVCRGSGYSFNRKYYTDDLSWNFNDTHGTGIVMLAGVEVEKLRQWERGECKRDGRKAV